MYLINNSSSTFIISICIIPTGETDDLGDSFPRIAALPNIPVGRERGVIEYGKSRYGYYQSVFHCSDRRQHN